MTMAGALSSLAFSPLAWGWSADAGLRSGSYPVLPTRVGMVRGVPARMLSTACSPHSRGDGPRLGFWLPSLFGFSPLAWGWSENKVREPAGRAVLPTRVGMVRD